MRTRRFSSSSKIVIKEEQVKCIDDILHQDIILAIFSWLLPEHLQTVAQVSKKWKEISCNNILWKPFCCKEWDWQPNSENPRKETFWKDLYLNWLRRMAKRLRETESQNEKMLQRHLEGKTSMFFPINFFWPSFKSLRERYTFKILVLGDTDTGKNSFVHRFTDQEFGSHANSELKMRTIEVFERSVELQILDSGYKDFHESSASCIIQAHACILLFDLTDNSSFQNIAKWMKKVSKFNSNTILYLIGSKSDLDSKRVVSQASAQEFAKAYQMPYLEISSKTGENVEQCFIDTAKLIFRSMAWPNYVPQEKLFRLLIGVKEVDWCVKVEGTKGKRISANCSIQ